MARRGKQFLEGLDTRIIVGDGAMGSRLYELSAAPNICYDYLNVLRPELVRQVHHEYFNAGARLLETNSFSANRFKLASFGLEHHVAVINRLSVELAREVAGKQAFVAGAVGPLPGHSPLGDIEELSEAQMAEAFREQVVTLADAGADVILLETFIDTAQIQLALREVKACCDLPVIAQMTFPDGRHAPDGVDALTALESLRRGGADVVGANCGHGMAKVIAVIEYLGSRTDAKLSAFPNAGMPQRVDGRYLYLATPQYIADAAEQLVRAGANLVGGCCGTSGSDIAAIAARVAKLKPVKRGRRVVAEPAVTAVAAAPAIPAPDFLANLKRKTVVLVELDPPKTTDLQRVVRGARALKEAGADAVTLGDSPLAVMRMNSVIAGAIIERDVEIPAICHLSCRDRNLIGTQSLLLGADALGVRHVLAITGDPAKVGDHPESSSVYDLNSFKLIELITRMNRGQNHTGQSIGRPTAFHVGVAFNPNVRNLDVELKRLQRKIDRGASFVLTQAAFDADAVARACAAIGALRVPVFAAVFPLLSHRHAEFLHNEFPGITVPDVVRARMAKAGPDKDAMAAEGMSIARELIDAYRACANGLYLIPPLNRHRIAVELLQYIHAPVRERSRAR